MKLTPFGEAVRVLRMRYDLSMKAMADALGISSSYMSGIEFGEKTLADKYVEGTLLFFRRYATTEELEGIQIAAERSKDVVNIATLPPDSRELVAAFARKLQSGQQPTDTIRDWLKERSK